VARTKKGDLNGVIADFAKVIELKPDNAEAYDNRAQDRFWKGDLAGASTDFTRTVALNPKQADGYNSLAWLLATAADSSVRNGPKAVEDATKACELGYEQRGHAGCRLCRNGRL
jgi:tetratricopeptide (TPR) repeat protein